MEKQIEELYKQLKAEFPDYQITMGIGVNHYSPNQAAGWHVQLEGEPKECKCCHSKKPESFAVWTEPTFDDALAKIREMIKEKGGEDE